MDKWVIVGAGGFVEGSVLPHFKKGMIKGLITRNAVSAIGLAKVYNIKIYPNLKKAKLDGCNIVYICSSSWTHSRWIERAIKVGLKVICEKPIITTQKDFETLKSLNLKNAYGSMIKRSHPYLTKLKNKKIINFYSYANALGSFDYKDGRTGSFLFIELIHYIDIALYLLGQGCKYTFEGSRVKGKISFLSKKQSINIIYDFNSNKSFSSLPFNKSIIKALYKKPEQVVIPVKELFRLYEILFDLDKKQRGLNIYDKK